MHKENFTTLLQDVEHAINALEQSLYYRSYLLVQKDLEENTEKATVSVVRRPMHENGKDGQACLCSNLGLNFAHEELSSFSKQKCFKRAHSWPSRLKDNLDFAKKPLLEQRVRVVESASALSVGTFATLLMEVALRLDYVVEEVCELSELARFAEMKEEKDTDVKIQVDG